MQGEARPAVRGPSKAKNSCVNLEIKLSYLPIKNGFIQEYQRMATWDKQAVAKS